MTFSPGDIVQPKPPHKHDHAGRPLPEGKVLEVKHLGGGQQLLIEGGDGKLMFLSGYFERVDA